MCGFYCFIVGASLHWLPSMNEPIPQISGLYAELQMKGGNIVCRLEFERSPIAVASFVGLAEGRFPENADKPYFDGLNFHRVEPGFVIQGGCPNGDGTGGPGYEFPNEVDSRLMHDKAGVLSMANAGPDTNGSQFFITLGPAKFLDGGYSVFGSVVSGMERVVKVKKGDVIERVMIHRKGAVDFAPTWEEFWEMIAQKLGSDEAGPKGAPKKTKKTKLAALLSYIEKNWPNDGRSLQQSDEGLYSKILIPGSGQSGEQAGAKQYTLHYSLWVPQPDAAKKSSGELLLNKVDSSQDRGQPLSVRPEQVVRGWGLTLPQMRKGEKRILLVPSELGYGRQGHPPVIPKDSYLLFEMECVGFR